jgi:hypothetical protein
MKGVYDDPELLLAIIILPGLFAATLLADGMLKRNRRQGGLVEFIFGIAFLVLIGVAYVILSQR